MKRFVLALPAVVVLLLMPAGVFATTINFQTNNSNDDLLIPGTGTGGGAASVYPSQLSVAQNVVQGFVVGTNVTRMDILLDDVRHGEPDELDILLVSPSGVKIMLMSDAGGTTAADDAGIGISTPCDIRFSSTAAAGDNLTAGVITCNQEWNPTNLGTPVESDIDGVGGAPAGPYTSGFGSFSVFLGPLAAANIFGTWSLYVFDDGALAGGTNPAGDFGMRDWKLSFTYPDPVVTTNAAPVPEPASLLLLGSGLAGLIAQRRRQRGR